MNLTRTALLAGAIALLGLTGTAQAGNSGVVRAGEESVAFDGAPGAGSRVTIARAGSNVRVTDPGGLTPGFGCALESQSDPTAAICRGLDLRGVASVGNVKLGDGADRVHIVDLPMADDARIAGGAGNDTIRVDGQGGYLVGGPGDDMLLGGSGGNALQGGPGSDRLNGRAGPDSYDGGSGRDQIDSRDGNSGNGENVDCGSGRETLVADMGDDPVYTCERVLYRDTSPRAAGRLQILGGERQATTNAIRPPGLHVRVRCIGGPCSGNVWLYGPKRNAKFSVKPRDGVDLQNGETGVARLPMATGWGSFHRRGGRFRARLVAVSGDAEGRSHTTIKRVTVVGRRGVL